MWYYMLNADLFLMVSFLQMWLTFAPIPEFSAAFYGVSRSEVDWFSVAFFVVSIIVGFVGIFILDTWGLKISVSSTYVISSFYIQYGRGCETFPHTFS